MSIHHLPSSNSSAPFRVCAALRLLESALSELEDIAVRRPILISEFSDMLNAKADQFKKITDTANLILKERALCKSRQ